MRAAAGEGYVKYRIRMRIQIFHSLPRQQNLKCTLLGNWVAPEASQDFCPIRSAEKCPMDKLLLLFLKSY